MPVDEIAFEAEELFEKSVSHLKDELRGIRTGRANTGLLEYLRVEAYGSMTELRNIAQVSVGDAQSLVIKPFDASVSSEIVKAIQSADMGLTPHSNEGGKLIRVSVPPLSGDRRAKLSAQVKKIGEETKVRIRNARRDARKQIEKEHKESLLTDDQTKKAEEDLDETTKKYETQVDAMVQAKQAELQIV